ncbi:CD109 antigen-like, partial [Paramuricea clavata]
MSFQVYVTLKASPDWKNINKSAIPSNNVTDGISDDVISVISVPANSGASVSFPIIPIKLGNIPIEIRAQSTTSADAVRRNLLVEPEGIEQDYSYSLLLDMKSTQEFRQELKLSLPSNIVKGSAKAMVSVIGDILGSSISGIENLLRMPYGCGEQNMINFAPSMFIRAYLETVGQLTPSIKEKSLRFMTLGYQRELSYQHRDGSYSAFGDKYGKSRPGSLWLTAFVVKSFSRALSYIYIDGESLKKSVNFILSTQQEDGSFEEPGSVSSYLQGGLKSNNLVALTAYVTVSLLEYGNQHNDVKEGIDNALRYLQANLNHTEDSYTLALAAYAMELANYPLKEIVLSKLLATSVRTDGTLYWTEETRKAKKQERPWFRPYYRPRSADIEITSYALLVYAQRRDRQNGLAIARWLAQQRNSLGGYSSTQ